MIYFRTETQKISELPLYVANADFKLFARYMHIELFFTS